MSYSDKYPLLLGFSSQGITELHGINEVAQFLCTKGLGEDLTIRTPDKAFFMNTIGMYIDRIVDKEYRAELLQVLIPMQHEAERIAFDYEEEVDDDYLESEGLDICYE